MSTVALPPTWGARPKALIRDVNRLALTQVDVYGCPYAVQWARLLMNAEGEADRMQWRDCLGRLYEMPLNWVLGYNQELHLRTRDHLHVCLRYSTYVLERDYLRWWEATS